MSNHPTSAPSINETVELLLESLNSFDKVDLDIIEFKREFTLSKSDLDAFKAEKLAEFREIQTKLASRGCHSIVYSSYILIDGYEYVRLIWKMLVSGDIRKLIKYDFIGLERYLQVESFKHRHTQLGSYRWGKSMVGHENFTVEARTSVESYADWQNQVHVDLTVFASSKKLLAYYNQKYQRVVKQLESVICAEYEFFKLYPVKPRCVKVINISKTDNDTLFTVLKCTNMDNRETETKLNIKRKESFVRMLFEPGTSFETMAK